MKKAFAVILGGALMCIAAPTSAAVVVTPAEAPAASFQTFIVSVSSEDASTMAVRVLLPEGLLHVTPNVKFGWNVNIVKEEGNEDRVLSLEWKGGSIPAGQRDEFAFSAQVPSKGRQLVWKAYQTYRDGSISAWDADPFMESDNGPYSVTTVADGVSHESKKVTFPIISVVSISALALSLIALYLVQKGRQA